MTTARRVIDVAADEVGYREGYSNGHYNNKNKYSPEVPGLEWSDYQAWCATFVSWVAMKAEVEDLYPRTASCALGVSWFKKQGRFSYYPAIGAQVFFGAGGGTHTGIVYNYDDNYIYTIEGNTNDSGSAEGNGVYLKKRERRADYTYGYGLPKFKEGIVSADPEFASEFPKPVEQPKPTPPTKPLMPSFPGREFFKVGKESKWVTHLDKVLIQAGYADKHDGNGYQPGPLYTTWTKANVRDFQLAQKWTGSDADGLVGPETWRRLHLKAGYREK